MIEVFMYSLYWLNIGFNKKKSFVLKFVFL